MSHCCRVMITFFAFGALLGGCSSPQSGLATAPLPGPSTASTLASAHGDLLYVVNGGDSVVFLTFPGGKPVGQLSGIGHPLNVCSDTSGNVWFTSSFSLHKYRLYEFAHGGTQPIATIDVPKSKTSVACAVNPTNGDLAVLNNYGEGSNDSVLIWAGAHSRMPKEYMVNFVPTACAYDPHGNLLATGWSDSDGYFFVELKIGATKFTSISVKVQKFLVGSVRWDGRYFAVAVAERRGSLIYRLRVSGSTGKIVQTIHPMRLTNPRWFWVKGATMVATKLSGDERLLGIWKYPLGGLPTKSFPGLTYPRGLTVSLGS